MIMKTFYLILQNPYFNGKKNHIYGNGSYINIGFWIAYKTLAATLNAFL